VFGISMWEVVLILIVALIVLGPKQLTETARVVGRLYRELQRMTSELRSSIDLDSPPSSPNYYEPPSPEHKGHSLDPFKNPEKKTGPDFYADLLEQSAEEDKNESEAESTQQESEKKGDSADERPKNSNKVGSP